MDAPAGAPQKAHRPSRNKPNKKSSGKNKGKQAVAKPGAFARRIRISADRAEKRALNPSRPVDRSGGDATPRVVAVVGPAAVGKSTIIRNLVRHYSKRSIPTISGPITVVTGRRKRITFLEVAADLSSMIDAAKVADLVLLVIDASFGFEMETFEFLNIAAAHGMPKIMSVLTHLDKLRDGKQVRRAKKSLKDRIWAELYDGAKVFYLSGITTTGDYLNREILNLARFISVTKYAYIKWRADHPYILADRVEDITAKSVPSTANRLIAAYGYIRGTPLRTTAGEWRVHLAGVGDIIARNIEHLPDPCPAPDIQDPHSHGNAANSAEQQKRKRKVSERDRAVYAPMAPEVDGISYDRDAVYINLAPDSIRFSRAADLIETGTRNGMQYTSLDGEVSSDGEGEKLVKDLQKENTSTVDESLKQSTLQLVSGGKYLVSKHFINGRRRRLVEFVDESDCMGKETSPKEEHENGAETENEGVELQEVPDRKLATGCMIGADEKYSCPDLSPSSNEEATTSDDSDWRSDGGDNDEISCEGRRNDEERAAQIWKNQMLDNAYQRLRRSASPSKALTNYVYKANANAVSTAVEKDMVLCQADNEQQVDEEDSDDEFFTRKRKHASQESEELVVFSLGLQDDLTRLFPEESKDWVSDEVMCAALKKQRFGTGQSKGSMTPVENEEDFFDEKAINHNFKDIGTSDFDKVRPVVEESRRNGNDESSSDSDIDEIRARKLIQKQEFDAEWDQRNMNTNSAEENADGNHLRSNVTRNILSRKAQRSSAEKIEDPRKVEQERLQNAKRAIFDGLHEEEKRQLEGLMPGQYIRLELQNVPVEFVKYFNPRYPVVLGGLRPSDDEGNMFIRARIRRHRFKRGVLKSHDPVIFSVGWRRFQSMPVYDSEDQGGRRRFLKYTPEYLHCNSTFWGPSVAPGAGVIMCQSLARDRAGFRIAGSGHVTEVDTSIEIVKKLKLIGEPFKVHKNTAFIKGMFSSELEVSKYIGASIRTVSGIRGTIKKGISEAAQRGALDRDVAKSPLGSFRGGFEDKILLSDIVFLRAWVPVEPKKFCSIATTLLDRERAGYGTWRMLTIREIREDKQLPIPLKKDSIYTPIDRITPKFAPLKISSKLESSLPYASKPKNFAMKKNPEKVPQRRAIVTTERAVVSEKKERGEQRLLQAVYTIRNERSKRRKAANARRLERRRQEWERDDYKRVQLSSERRKRKFAIEGARETRSVKRNRGEASMSHSQ